MEKFDIQADRRVITRLVRAGTQGNPIRALIELITNSDDSYRRLEEERIRHGGLIEVLYGKESYSGLFSVRDAAEGMSYNDVRAAFRKYGAATSGLKEGKSVTGFFGTGAKNALAGMTGGCIYTIKNNAFCRLRLFLLRDSLKGELEGPEHASQKIRCEYGIPGDGTLAFFRADPERGQNVPRFDTVHADLANHWRLRKIMTNPSRTVLLVDLDENNKKKRLRYVPPKGHEKIKEKFTVQCENYGEFFVRLSIWRGESELRQEGEDRPGGLLILDDRDVTLDMSLFKYDREPLAARFFGEARIGGLRALLAREEPVLNEAREGLNRSHPVCKAVVSEIEKRIERLVQEESRRQKEARGRIDSEERTRYRDAFNVLNEIAEAEAEETCNLSQQASLTLDPPPNGLCLYPDSAHVSIGKRYVFEVRIDTKKFGPRHVVRMYSNNPKLVIVGSAEFKVGESTDAGVARRFVTVQGTEVGVRAVLRATIGRSTTDATVYVEPEKSENEYLYKHGLVFRPESLTVRMNRTRRALLRVYLKVVEEGSKIVLKSESPSVHVWPEEILVRETDAIRHVAEYKIEVWGEESEVTAIVTAETEAADALLEVRTRVDEEPERPKGTNGNGMFSAEPYFDQEDAEPLQRVSYSRETGTITIYVNFPSNRFYLGEDLRFRKTLAAQVLIADLISERCFFEMARAKKRDVAISPEALPERIQRDAQELSRKYGVRVHKALVDPDLVRKDQTEARDPVRNLR